MTDDRERIRRLTERVRCAGWAGKLGPAELAQVLGALVPSDDPRVLVDQRTCDDAAVVRLDANTALVQTVDFFTPVVDDPFAYGAIAAANAVSDVYAMGGRPITALSIAGFPEADFPLEWARQIVRGGQETLTRASCALVGGHSVRDPEIKFGYAVTGLVDPERILTNAAGRAGQVLVLTKPIGTGIVATALKAGEAPEPSVRAATESMTRLNREASEAALAHGVTAATDVTGFGLAGHACAIARESGLTLEIELRALPQLPGAMALAERFQPGGLQSNRREFEPLVEYAGRSEELLRVLAYDPQTSGGLLLLAPEAEADVLVSKIEGARVVGRARQKGPRPLVFRA